MAKKKTIDPVESQPRSDISMKDIIREELKRCAASPVYFMKKYCKIQHPQKGTLPFHLYDFQCQTLEELLQYNYNIILKSRQLGISTLCAGFALWLIIFNSDKNVLVIATKQDVAKNLVTKVRFMFDRLPSWIRLLHSESSDDEGTEEDNKLSLRLRNGSQIKAVSSSSDAGRSEALSMLIIDEAAFIEDEKVKKIWTSAQQTLATGGRAIILSTPNGSNNWFHQKWQESEEKGAMHTIRLPWYVHPERDQSWRDEQDGLLGKRAAAQECDADFISSGATVLDPELLAFIKSSWIEEPIEKRFADHSLWIWDVPNYTKSYIVVADVARGDASDWSAAHVIDVETATQVAEYKNQIGTTEFGHLLVNLSVEYNNALLVVENANVGWATCQTIIDRNYPNLYYSYRDINYVDQSTLGKNFDLRDKANMVPGFTTSVRTRPLIISRMELYFRERECRIKSIRTFNELNSFIWKGGKPQANQGYNDDLVMAWAIGLWTRDTALKLRQQGIELNKSAISHFTSTKPVIPLLTRTNLNQDPWKMKISNNPQANDNQEDITWLL